MQITYQCTTADHMRCFGKSVRRKPQLLAQLIAAPLFLSLVNALVVHHGNRVLLFVGMFAAIMAFFVLAIWSQCAQRSKRACTTGVWYDGIHDIAPEKTSFMPWANIIGARVDDGDVFIDSVNVASGIYIGRSAFSPQFLPDVLVECINRARHGDFSMIVPPPQPAYPAPQYAQIPPQQPNVWPPPPGQG